MRFFIINLYFYVVVMAANMLINRPMSILYGLYLFIFFLGCYF